MTASEVGGGEPSAYGSGTGSLGLDGVNRITYLLGLERVAEVMGMLCTKYLIVA
jgi:hypothetical protein